MILDKACEISKYKGLSPQIDIAIDYIEHIGEKKAETGRVDLREGVFVLISQYETIENSEKKWEAHQKYIDLQYMLQGSEVMGYANITKMESSHGYSEEKDIEFFDYSGDYNKLLVEEGMFAVFFPEDAHAPCIRYNQERVKKLVVKIPV